MRGSSHAFVLITSLVFLTAAPAAASQATTPIPLSAAPAEPEPVPSWDPASPQQLVRVEGRLYQLDSGLFRLRGPVGRRVLPGSEGISEDSKA